MAYTISLILYTVGILTLLEGYHMIRRGGKRIQYKLYGYAAFFSALWSISFAILWIQTDPEKARICRAIGMIGLFVLFIVLTEIFIQFLDSALEFKVYVRVTAYLGVFLWPFVIGKESVTYIPTDIGMSYLFSNNIYNILYNIFCVTIGVNYFVIFYKIFKNATRKKLQIVALRMCVCCIVVIIGMIFDTLLPIFGFSALPASTFSQGIGVLMLASVLKFQLTSEISIENMSEYVYYSVSTPILIYNENEKFCIANTGAADFFNEHYEAIRSKKLWEVFTLPSDCMHFEGNKRIEEVECICNERYCSVEINKILDEYQDVTGYIVIFSDLTEKRDFIQKLQESEHQAEMANLAKTNFLARMSHEIRTPINGIIGMNEVILRDSKDEKTLKYAHMVNVSAHNLVELVNDILDISKLEANRISIENQVYQLPSLLKEIKAVTEVRAQNKKLNYEIRISGNLPVQLNGDEKKLRQIMMNIISNAIKYTREGSVNVRLEGITRDGQYCLGITVKDTGIGIKPENIDKIFDAFERVDSVTNTGIEGTGLGLYIVKNLLKIMGGRIEVRSEYGKGTEFIIEIPQIPIKGECFNSLENITEQHTDDVTQIDLQIPDKKILVVDDNEINRFVASELLSYTKATIETADSGRACLDMVSKNKYDFILLDHIMPEMDGIQVLQELKKMPNNISKEAKIIILTANAIQGAKEEYLAKGFDDYLPKPIDMGQVEEVLGKYC